VIVEELDIISKHEKGMHFYCHASQFNREYKVAPDFTNLMYSWLVSPWDRHTIFPWRPDLPTSAPSESDYELAGQIVSSEVDKNNLKKIESLFKKTDEKIKTTQPKQNPKRLEFKGRGNAAKFLIEEKEISWIRPIGEFFIPGTLINFKCLLGRRPKRDKAFLAAFSNHRDPVGIEVEKWTLVGAFITNASFDDYAYDAEDITRVKITVQPDRCLLAA